MIYPRGFKSKEEWRESKSNPFVSGLDYFKYKETDIVPYFYSKNCTEFKRNRGVDLHWLHVIISKGLAAEKRLHLNRLGNLVRTSSLIRPI